MSKILVVTPRFPFPATGADEQDRAYGIEMLKKLGYEVRVIAKIFPFQKPEDVELTRKKLGIPITTIPYRAKQSFSRFSNFSWLDGAAYEWTDPEVKKELVRELDTWKPDVVWFDHTYLWPLYREVKKRNIPIITRSANDEARHFLDEEGRSPLNLVKYLAKRRSEKTIARMSDLVFAITPNEAKRYSKWGAPRVMVLPLRALPTILERPFSYQEKTTKPLKVIYMPSTSNVNHNQKATEMVVKEIAPKLAQVAPGEFQIFITGAKHDPKLIATAPPSVTFTGFVEDMGAFIHDADIAIAPSVFGCGMQQKVFEPLAMGIPTITSPRALQGWTFESEKEVLLATTADEYVAAIQRLINPALRRSLSVAAHTKAAQWFGRGSVEGVLQSVLGTPKKGVSIEYLAFSRIPTEKAHGIQIMKTCEALFKEGADIELVVPNRSTHIKEDAFSYYGVTKFPLSYVPVIDLVWAGPIGFVLSLLMFAERVVWRPRFWMADIIYSRDAFLLLQFLLLRRKFIYEAHGKPSRIARVVARRAFRVVVITDALRKVFEEAGVPKEKIVHAPDAVDIEKFATLPEKAEARKLLGLPTDKPIALYTGHLYKRKGAEVFGAAAQLIPEVFCVLVGGTAADKRHFDKKWGQQANMLVVEHVPPPTIPMYLRSADVLVLPNSGKNEDSSLYTSPMKLFEYMASGTPIVASNVPSLREVLNEQTAAFVEADNRQTLATGIKEALADPGSPALALAAQEEAKKYTWSSRAQKILTELLLK